MQKKIALSVGVKTANKVSITTYSLIEFSTVLDPPENI